MRLRQEERGTDVAQRLLKKGMFWPLGKLLSLEIVWAIAALSVAADPLDHWTRGNVGTPALLRAVAYGNGYYVAVADQGWFFTSTDGSSWVGRQSGRTDSLWTICYGNGTFVVGEGNPVRPGYSGWAVLTSRDGMTWQRTVLLTCSPFSNISFTHGKFVATLGNDGCGGVAFSDDGVHWTESLVRSCYASAFGNGLWLAAAQATMVSETGTNWTVTAESFVSFGSIAFGNGTFVGMARATSSPGNPYTTTDGLQWTQWPTRGPVFRWGTVAFAHDTFVMAGDTGVICTSRTGTNWIERVPETFSDTAPAYVSYCNGRVMIVGDQGVVLQSDHYGPPLLRLSMNTGRVEAALRIVAEKEKVCVIERSRNLQNWTEWGRYTNDNDLAEFNVPVGTNSAELYRVQVE